MCGGEGGGGVSAILVRKGIRREHSLILGERKARKFETHKCRYGEKISVAICMRKQCTAESGAENTRVSEYRNELREGGVLEESLVKK